MRRITNSVREVPCWAGDASGSISQVAGKPRRINVIVVHQLEVFVLDERRTVSMLSELAEVIASRVDGGTHFEIATASSSFPMLDVMVRDPYAVVHYFAHDGATGDQAASNIVEPPEAVTFPHGALGATITMPGSVLVDAATAMACVVQFAQTLSRPTLVGWIEL